MKVILIANLAGGVGKTSIVHSLATAVAEYGKRALAVDADPAATLTFLCGLENPRYTSRELFDGSQTISNVSVKTINRFSLLPSASRLLHTDFAGLSNLKSQFSDYDLVLIDSPTGPSPLMNSLISIADEIIAPVDGRFLSIRGVLNLRDFVRRSGNPVPIRILENSVSNWDSELRSALSEEFSFIDVILREGAELPISQAKSASVLSDSPHSEIASDYRELAYLLLEEIGLL